MGNGCGLVKEASGWVIKYMSKTGITVCREIQVVRSGR